MIKDKKKLARVIATWVVTTVMLSVFIIDICVVALGNKYTNALEITDTSSTVSYGDDKIHFLNTANSDCILIESNGMFALVDSGEGSNNPRRKTEYRHFSKEVIEYIEKTAINTKGKVELEFILGTHMHYDHSGNFVDIINRDITINKAYFKEFNDLVATETERTDWGNKQLYLDILSACKEKNIPVIADLPTEEFTFGDFTLKFLNTRTPEELYGNGENASSVGIIVKKGTKKAFLSADFTNTSGLEDYYVNDIGDVDLLKMGHHGYYGSSSADFIRQIKPEIAIVTNYPGKIYPNVKWNLTVIAKAPILSTAHRNGIIATFTDDGRIALTQNIMG